MLHFTQNIEAIKLPKNCQLVIKGTYGENATPDASKKRLAEYLLSRDCLKDCSQKFGYEFQFDQTGSNKKITTNKNLIYSISHSKNVACALVATKSKYSRCGVDLEYRDRALTDKFINRITTPLERKLLEKYPEKRQQVATLLFSAKETVFKAFSDKINSFSYQNIEIWEENENLKAIIINQEESLPTLSLYYGFYKQTHLVTCLIMPKY